MSNTLRTLKELEQNQDDNGGDKISGIMKIIADFPSSGPVTFVTNQFKWFKGVLLRLVKKGGRFTWILATSALLTIVPLIIEVEREQFVIETENLHIQNLKAQGYTQAQLSEMGYRDQSTLSGTQA